MDKSEFCCSNCKKEFNIGDEVYFNLNFISYNGKYHEIDNDIYCKNCSKIFHPEYSDTLDKYLIYELKQRKAR